MVDQKLSEINQEHQKAVSGLTNALILFKLRESLSGSFDMVHQFVVVSRNTIRQSIRIRKTPEETLLSKAATAFQAGNSSDKSGFPDTQKCLMDGF